MSLGIPRGDNGNSGVQESFHYRMFPAVANSIEDLFNWHQAPIKPNSELDRILKAARSLGAKAEIPEEISVSATELFDAHCCARIANSVLALDYRPTCRRYFSDLQKGNLNFWNSEQSKAKDTEWELFLWSYLNRGMPRSAELFEPDILLRLPFRQVGIACKKAYTARSVIRQIEAGARQIAASKIPGIIAVSLDFFIGENQHDHSHVRAQHDNELQRGILTFLNSIWRDVGRKVVTKYLRSGRVLGIIFGLQTYTAFRNKPHQFIEAIAMRYQSDRLGPTFSTQIMDYLYKTLDPTNPSGGFGGNFIVNRIAELKALRPIANQAPQQPRNWS